MTTTSKPSNTTTDKVQKKAAETAENLKSEAKDVAQTAAKEASQYADQAKDVAADEVKGVASALRTAADEMRSGSPQERTMSQIAEGIADVSDSIRDKDLSEMVGTVSDFARRNPIAFLGGAALLGFVATRFAKASSQGNHQPQTYASGSRNQSAPIAQGSGSNTPDTAGGRS